MYDFIVWFNNLGMWYNFPMAIFSFSVIFLSIWSVGSVVSFILIGEVEKTLPAIIGVIPSIIGCFLIFIAGLPAIGAGPGYYSGCMENKGATYEKCKPNLTTGVKKETLKKWGYRV